MKFRNKIFSVGMFAALLLAMYGSAFAGEWPEKVFAPYAYIPRNFTHITNCLQETGHKFYTLAFIISDSEGRPAWDGSSELGAGTGYYAEEIKEVRAHGGDVLISFGGEADTEIAINTSDARQLEAKYQSVIDQYHLTWMDFDIEGKALSKVEANQRRNAAIKQLQSKNPELKISFTLPVNPTGLEEESLVLLRDTEAKGVAVESVNIMTMDYGRDAARGKKMGELAVAAANATHEQLRSINPAIKIGITPMIGVNDEKSEVFSLDDAKVVMEFAKKTAWVRSVSFWSVNRDRPGTSTRAGNRSSGIAQEKWDFTNIFKELSQAPAGSGR